MDIYNILSSHADIKSIRNLKRYIKFIETRTTIKGHKHHICPKSLFPEYKSFSKNQWNKLVLTHREHIHAHILLHKIFKGKMTQALYFMTNNSNYKLSSKLISEIHAERCNWISSNGYRWATNGIDTIFILDQQLPEGFTYGRNLDLDVQTREHMSLERSSRKYSEKFKENRRISALNQHKNRTDEQRQEIGRKISNTHKIRQHRNSRAKVWKFTNVVTGEIIIVDDRAKFCKERNLKYNAIRDRANKNIPYCDFICEEVIVQQQVL